MRKILEINPLERIIDANINRAKEGLRVCEEITRFILDSRRLTGEIKKIRHSIDALVRRLPAAQKLLKARKSLSDVGRTIYGQELKRKNLSDVFFANIKRVQESIRVLEEFTKLGNSRLAVGFKKIRYESYEIEKKVAAEISSLRHHR